MSEPVKTICLEISRHEAFLLIAALQKMRNDTVGEILSTEKTDKIYEFELLRGMSERIEITCAEVGLVNSESSYDLRKEIERKEHDRKENKNDT